MALKCKNRRKQACVVLIGSALVALVKNIYSMTPFFIVRSCVSLNELSLKELLRELTPLRKGVLCRVADDDTKQKNTTIIDQLPTLTHQNKHEFPEWHEYYERVYKKPVQSNDCHSDHICRVDLNKFTWFYWIAPFQNITSLNFAFCNWNDSLPEVPYGTPWTGGRDAWTWGPEHKLRRLGFFVHRPPTFQKEDAKVEVMRTTNAFTDGVETQRSHAWFFHTIGSGVFLDPSELVFLKQHYQKIHSVPRVELQYKFKSSSMDTWDTSLLNFSLGNLDPCNLTAKYTSILTCSNLALPLWDGDDPLDEC